MDPAVGPLSLWGEQYDLVRRWPQDFFTQTPAVTADGALVMEATTLPFARYCCLIKRADATVSWHWLCDLCGADLTDMHLKGKNHRRW